MQKYIREMKLFLSHYNVTEAQKINILNIYETYVNAILNGIDFGCLDVYPSNINLENFTNIFKSKVDNMLNNDGLHELYLNYIVKNQCANVTFELKDEENLYHQIIYGLFNFEVYCLTVSNYDDLRAILHSIANKLGYGEFLRNKFKDMQSTNQKSDPFTKLRKAIKNVE